MKVSNLGKSLLCINTKAGRVDILPGVVTDDERLDGEKGKNKIFDHYLKAEVLKEVKDAPKKTPKELLEDEALGLGIDITDMTKADLTAAIAEAKADV